MPDEKYLKIAIDENGNWWGLKDGGRYLRRLGLDNNIDIGATAVDFVP